MWIFLAILAVPLIEIGLFVTVGGEIGLWPTLAWVLLSAALGLFVMRRVARDGAVSLRQDMLKLGDPLSPIAQRVMLVLAGVLLLLPGFLTDTLGLLLLLKPVRTGLILLITRRMRIVTTASRATRAEAEVIEGDWRAVEEEPQPPRSDRPSGWTQH